MEISALSKHVDGREVFLFQLFSTYLKHLNRNTIIQSRPVTTASYYLAFCVLPPASSVLPPAGSHQTEGSSPRHVGENGGGGWM